MAKYNISTRKLIRLLKDNGYFFVRQNGSHAIFKNYGTENKVIVPIHSKDIPMGTVHAILKDAKITLP